MLLVCPKCKANYEIPRHAVPISGREVKCADCGHSWFQTRTKKSNDDKLIEPQTEIKKGDTVEEVASGRICIIENPTRAKYKPKRAVRNKSFRGLSK